ncbi:MAG: S8 family serine peptidase, partial [Bacteroidia bacterium]|nr:S8 family serine peptidase [Bacteroidia bacterium]
KTSLVGIYNLKRGFAEERPGAALDYSMLLGNEEEKISVKNNVSEKEFYDGYGLGWDQISQINGQALHRAGYRGNGIQIAVLDAGFYRANLMSAFDSLFKTKNFLGSYDLVDGGNNVFNDDDHGTQVLSCMASNAPGVMVGTAPEASYLLIRTEDAGAEMPCEEINWLCGAELADSAGVDIISSSLGYTEFDDSRFGHHYNELNGNTTIITRAANMAWDRGILIVNSAGNEGDGKWKHIGAPADAFGVIAIGAVDRDGDLADFSSVGPTADNRVKPDLVALGKNTTVINSNGYFIHSDGTSFSAPVLAGALACFLQYDGFENPVKTRNLLLLSAQHTLHADNQTGKGLPDMELAMKLSKHDTTVSSVNPFINWPDNDTLTQAFELKTVRKPSTSYQYKLKNNLGFTLESGILFPYEGVLFAASLEPKDKGFYKLEITDGADKWNCKFYFATPKKSKKNEKAR